MKKRILDYTMGRILKFKTPKTGMNSGTESENQNIFRQWNLAMAEAEAETEAKSDPV